MVEPDQDEVLDIEGTKIRSYRPPTVRVRLVKPRSPLLEWRSLRKSFATVRNGAPSRRPQVSWPLPVLVSPSEWDGGSF